MKKTLKFAILLTLYASASANGQDVELLMTPGQSTVEEDLAFTIVTGIKIEGEAWFYQQKKMISQSLLLSPVAQWQQRFSEQYLGFLLASEKSAAGYKWSGKLKVYFGKISEGNRGVTQAWPQSRTRDRSFQQAVESAQSFKQVDAPTVNETIRIYYAPNNIGWHPPSAQNPEGAYQQNDSLVILYIDPETGAKKRGIFSPSEFYALRSNPTNPLDQSMVSIWYTVKAGAIDFSYLEAAEEERGIPVNLYTTQIFVFDDWDEGGYVYGASEDDPILAPEASGEDVASLSLILKKAKGESVDEAELAHAVQEAIQLMRSI